MTRMSIPPQSDPSSGIRDELETLLKKVESKDGVIRERARLRLQKIGHPAVPRLIQILHHLDAQARWEAAKALLEIADPTSASALVDALEDEDMDVRWVAAEGLIALTGEGLRPLFEALVKRPKSGWLREGAHHVLHELRIGHEAQLIAPVLEALSPNAPAIEVAVAAHAALHQLHARKTKKKPI